MTFSTAQAARLTGCSESQLAAWSRAGLVAGHDPAGHDHAGYSFRDLVALRVVASLLDSGLPLARIRKAVGYLIGSGDDLAGLRLVTDGQRVWACRDDGQILDALRHGQLALFVDLDRFAAEVDGQVRAFDTERATFVDALRRVEV